MFTELLYQSAHDEPDRPFLYFEERVISYGEMADLVSAFAGVLRDRGVGAGQNVALVCGNRPAFLIAWFALTELGAVTVPLNTALIADGLRYTLAQSEARTLLIEPELLDQKAQHLGELIGELQVIGLDARVERLDAEPRPRRAEPAAPGAPNSILYTSGTTGLPKGAVIPNASYLQAGPDMAAALDLKSDDRILLFLPLFHANPQMYGVMSALHARAALILLDRFSAGEFFDQAKHYKATGFTFVGTVLSILDKRHAQSRRDHGMRWCVGGGAPADVWKVVEDRFGLSVRELYGMTETGGWVSINIPPHSRRGSVGRARPGVELSIVDAGGQPLPPGERGEIVVRSDRPHLFFEGYWKKPEATAATLKDGWLHTGDRGWLDEDGFLYFDGRVKELIRRGGEMISPVEIELQLLKHPEVRDCGVFAVPDDVMGEEIKAAIVADGSPSVRDLEAFLSQRLPKYMVPRYFVFVHEIAKTETQKIKRHELAALRGPEVDVRML